MDSSEKRASAQGTQFTRKAVIEFIQNQKWIQSMPRRGNWWDNTVIESFFSIIKREELKWHTLHSRHQAHQVITRYIYEYYLPIRHIQLWVVYPHTLIKKIRDPSHNFYRLSIFFDLHFFDQTQLFSFLYLLCIILLFSFNSFLFPSFAIFVADNLK